MWGWSTDSGGGWPEEQLQWGRWGRGLSAGGFSGLLCWGASESRGCVCLMSPVYPVLLEANHIPLPILTY